MFQKTSGNKLTASRFWNLPTSSNIASSTINFAYSTQKPISMASNASGVPYIFRLPRELRDKIWEFALAPRVAFTLPNLTDQEPDDMPYLDYYGEGVGQLSSKSHESQIESYRKEYIQYHQAIYDYFESHKPIHWRWIPNDIPRCRNIFYTRFADTNFRTANRQVYEETSVILSPITYLLRDSVQGCQIQINALPAFAQLFGQSAFRVDFNTYDMISFLLTTERSILSKVESVFFAEYWVKDWVNNGREGRWDYDDGYTEITGKNGLLTTLLNSNLDGLGEVAIWAPTKVHERDYVNDYPFDVLEDLIGLCKSKKLYQVQILFAYAWRGSSRDRGFPELIQEHLDLWDDPPDCSRIDDRKEVEEVERHWGTSGIKAVLTVKYFHLEDLLEDTRFMSSTTD
jgi:hypothetical protein